MLIGIEIVFFIALLLVIHSYLLYPASLAFLSAIGKRYEFYDAGKPTTEKISILISAYNEAATIKKRITGLLSIDYPSFEVIVGVDGATDGTAEILQEIGDNRLKVIRYETNRGKVWVLNDLYEHTDGSILMFTDANTDLNQNALAMLERHFGDERVGGVSGRQETRPYHGSKEMRVESEYWKIESWIKQREGDRGMTLGGNGSVYAIRRDLFMPFDTQSRIADDFILPLKVIEKGYYFVYEPEAVAIEQSGDLKGEFRRKMRIGAAVSATLKAARPLMNPSKGFIAYSLWSHKIIRWFVPYLLVIILISNILLLSQAEIFRIGVIVQFVFYSIAAVGIFGLSTRIQIPIVAQLGYFVVANAALFTGITKALVRHPETKWEVSRN